MIDSSNWPLLLSGFIAVFVISRVMTVINGVTIAGRIPGRHIAFHPLVLPGVAFPTSWWNPGLRWTWEGRLNNYQKFNSALISMVPFLSGKTTVFTSSMEVARQIIAGGVQSPWIKPEFVTKPFAYWGMNLAQSENETWRRHRRIVGPAFNPTTYSLVWSETSRVFRDMVLSEGWDQKNIVEISDVHDYTFKLALFVLSACAFGWPFSWEEPPMSQDGSMGIQRALRVYTDGLLIHPTTPEWAYKLPIPRLREFYKAREVLREYMAKQIAERKAEIHGNVINEAIGVVRQDVFTLMVRASESNDKLKLNDSELVGNMFALMFAGHENTARTLAATLGLLSIYPDIQKEVYEEIVSVVGNREPTFEDFGKLQKVTANFYESLRLYPAAYLLVREAAEDTVLNIPNEDGQPGTHPVLVPKGLQVVVDMVGVQYNPKYFHNPSDYDPTRWYNGASDSEAATAFSIGPRTCIGRKFAVIEAVCFLTLLLREWHVDPAMQPGETREQWRKRVMDAHVWMSLGVGTVPIKLIRRKPL